MSVTRESLGLGRRYTQQRMVGFRRFRLTATISGAVLDRLGGITETGIEFSMSASPLGELTLFFFLRLTWV